MHSKIKLSNAGLATLLAALSMLGPFSIDAYLPAFSSIQTSLHASSIEVQQTLTAYMLSFAAMTLWHGALSDSFGRRNVVLVALVVFAIGSFGCASAHTVHYLWVFRIMQGVAAGAGMVIGRAIVRDLYEGAPAERLLSLVTMIFSIAPAIAPIIGGWVVSHSDWRTIFLLLFVYTVLLLIACYKYLPESLPVEKRQPFNVNFLWESYRDVFKSPGFHFMAGTIACNFAGIFLFISSAPAFVTQHLKLDAQSFGWQFVPMVGGIFLGSLAANRLAGRLTITRQVSIGFMFLLSAAFANVVFHFFSMPMLPWSVIPLFFYAFGMSVVFPGATLMVLELFPHIRGIVASCQSASVTLLSAVVAGVMAPALDHSVLSLALGQLGFALLGLALWYAGRVYARRHKVIGTH
ncbi:multidrug effflux MFS transporter [Undibacterium baiyunense]|jgi:DHA1 family bicyclomycin/chloramphenicol resistance-like MFS transporter|uniref:Bcr/CflA family efflux transporter n=1 Tax=Undibacterium baiyunense TaxID=2828731 RepID=A0A941I3Y6_9BURK|nr:multidrug effflux MFS transporter [Undibacterium baiyunense]MBR7747365.1 multidrug effflux MFS transporter [Undibacterium baiyunense]